MSANTVGMRGEVAESLLSGPSWFLPLIQTSTHSTAFPRPRPSLGFEGLSHMWLETFTGVCLTLRCPGGGSLPSFPAVAGILLPMSLGDGLLVSSHIRVPLTVKVLYSQSREYLVTVSYCSFIMEGDQVGLQAYVQPKPSGIGVHLLIEAA